MYAIKKATVYRPKTFFKYKVLLKRTLSWHAMQVSHHYCCNCSQDVGLSACVKVQLKFVVIHWYRKAGVRAAFIFIYRVVQK